MQLTGVNAIRVGADGTVACGLPHGEPTTLQLDFQGATPKSSPFTLASDQELQLELHDVRNGGFINVTVKVETVSQGTVGASALRVTLAHTFYISNMTKLALMCRPADAEDVAFRLLPQSATPLLYLTSRPGLGPLQFSADKTSDTSCTWSVPLASNKEEVDRQRFFILADGKRNLITYSTIVQQGYVHVVLFQ